MPFLPAVFFTAVTVTVPLGAAVPLTVKGIACHAAGVTVIRRKAESLQDIVCIRECCGIL